MWFSRWFGEFLFSFCGWFFFWLLLCVSCSFDFLVALFWGVLLGRVLGLLSSACCHQVFVFPFYAFVDAMKV